MSTHNRHFHDKKWKTVLKYHKYLFSRFIGIVSKGLKIEFELATLNESYAFLVPRKIIKIIIISHERLHGKWLVIIIIIIIITIIKKKK